MNKRNNLNLLSSIIPNSKVTNTITNTKTKTNTKTNTKTSNSSYNYNNRYNYKSSNNKKANNKKANNYRPRVYNNKPDRQLNNKPIYVQGNINLGYIIGSILSLLCIMILILINFVTRYEWIHAYAEVIK